jgi:hypothetical protein
MKRIIKYTSVILVAAALLVFSCKKKDETPAGNSTTTTAGSTTSGSTTGGGNTGGSMSVTKNGTAWSTTSVSAVLLVDDDNDMSAISINGFTSADIIILGIDFPTASTTLTNGNHNIDDAGLIMYTQRTSGGGTLTEHVPDEGTVNITSVDNTNKKISGTFSCIMHKVGSSAPADSLKLTNGVFTNVSYIISHQ